MSSGAQSSDVTDAQGLLSVFGTPLLDALDGETDREAARALCLLADAEPSLATPLAGRLVEQVREVDDHRPFLRTLATLAAAHEQRVRHALDERSAGRRLRAALADTDGWRFDERADGGTDVARAVRQVVGTDDDRGSGTDVVERRAETGDTRQENEDRRESAGREPDADRAAAREHRGDPAAVDRRARLERAEQSRAFRAISLLGTFDDLTVVEPEQAVRYGSSLRTRATVDGTERGIALRLFDLPEGADARRTFAAETAESLAQWAGIADTDGVATVFDWGDYPRPWVATPYLDGSLADRGRPGIERALREAAHLAGTVATCHNNGAVHGGIDPQSVVYPSTSFDGLPAPRLDNVGLMSAVRSYFEPSDYLDPRYAAPEYFSREYGSIDAATDVYALGGVCYRLLTGRPPFTGEYDAVRQAVLDDSPPQPTAVNPRLPAAADDIVAKAMATDKLTRYETAAAVRRDCWRLVQSLD